MDFLGVHIIIGVTAFLAIGLTATYALAVALGHVNPLWCYISYTGNYSVESCIFSYAVLMFVVSWGSHLCASGFVNAESRVWFSWWFPWCLISLWLVLGCVSAVLCQRFTQLSNAISISVLPDKEYRRRNIVNAVSLAAGVLGAFGLSMTGCFQQRVFRLLHITGVILCTCFTLAYVIVQTYFTYALPVLGTSLAIKSLRMTIAVLSSGIFAVGSAFAVSSSLSRPHGFHVLSSEMDTDDVGSKVGAGFEWTLFILNLTFVCSFCPDFRKIALRKDQIVFL